VRSWRTAENDPERVFLYFRAHPDKFLTPEHVAAQVKIGKRRARRIVTFLVREAKLEAVDTVSSKGWGRPKKMFRAVRTNDDTLAQLEVFRKVADTVDFVDPYG
jgi:predicted ArsR family transcriptional regulator